VYAGAVEDATDAALVARIAGGSGAQAEAELCARYRRRIYLYGLRQLRDAAAADDLVQDVLATVIERLRAGAIEDADKLGGFVLGTCRMHVINRRRGEARRSRLLALYGDPRLGDDAAPGDLADLDRVRACLERLPDRDRAALLLAFYAELDGEALGRELGVTAAHARVIRHRALSRLQGCVKGEEER